MNKQFFIGLFCIFGVAYAAEPAPQVETLPSVETVPVVSNPARVLSDDTYLQNLVKSHNDQHVQFRKGCLLLFADVSLLRIILETSGAVLAGLGCWYVLKHCPFQKPFDDYTFAGGCGIGAVVGSFFAVRDIERRLTSIPYVVLSDRGLYVWGEKVCDWIDFETVVCERTVYTNKRGFTIDEYYTVYLKNAYGSTIATFGGQYDCLPIKVDDFAELLAHCKDYIALNHDA